MGFLNWVMTGLGFESDKGEKKEKQKQSKEVATINPEDEKYTNFNLHEKIEAETISAPSEIEPNSANAFSNPLAGLGIQTESDIIMLEPHTHKEIQQIVDYLKQGQTVAVNLEGISSEDSERILDFLSGAVYGLNASIHRWKGDLFLLAPEGHRILKKSNQ